MSTCEVFVEIMIIVCKKSLFGFSADFNLQITLNFKEVVLNSLIVDIGRSYELPCSLKLYRVKVTGVQKLGVVIFLATPCMHVACFHLRNPLADLYEDMHINSGSTETLKSPLGSSIYRSVRPFIPWHHRHQIGLFPWWYWNCNGFSAFSREQLISEEQFIYRYWESPSNLWDY